MFLSYFLGGYPEDYNLSSNNIVQINTTSTATLYENFAIMYKSPLFPPSFVLSHTITPLYFVRSSAHRL